MQSRGEDWGRDMRNQWRKEKRAFKEEWRQRRAEWRESGSTGGWTSWRPQYGWTGVNIAAMVVAFILFAPLGFAILAWNIWSSRQIRMSSAYAHGGSSGGGWRRSGCSSWGSSNTSRDLSRDSGNAVFEDYKRATLERLEEERRKLAAEQEAFGVFLNDLKRAKDRTEFENFMQEREKRREQEAKDAQGPNDAPTSA